MATERVESLIEQIRGECVRLLGRQPGCGFPVAQGWLITCAHVVGRETPLGSPIEARPWRGVARQALLRHLDRETDLALLEDPATAAATAVFGDDIQRGDPLVGIGFPVREQQPELDGFTAELEFITRQVDQASGREMRLVKLKAGHIEYGFSGGPVINPRSGRVIGVTRLSRDTQLDLGGWAIPADAVRAFCDDAGIDLTPPDALQPAVGGMMATMPTERLRDLLLSLPGWNSRRRRLSLLEIALGRGHPVLRQVEWEGSAAQLAWDVAKACEDYPEPTASGLSPACALLAAIPRELGRSPARDLEIRALGAMLSCSELTGP